MSSIVQHQLILFGPPGTSKSRQAREKHAVELGISQENIVPVTFHPDFSYGEFVARLLPLTKSGKIEYNVHAGPFIRALALAYTALANVTEKKPANNVMLLIDEINRGNCAEIFGDVFQLLDRDDDGWSSYEISASTLVIEALNYELAMLNTSEEFSTLYTKLPEKVTAFLGKRQLKLPPNLLLIGTMNTSDESVYFMDSAFKRRWNFEFRSVEFDGVPSSQRDAIVTREPYRSWATFLNALNHFILEKCTSPKLDDKLVGPWFIKAKRKVDQLLSLDKAYPTEWRSLEADARKVGEYNLGAQYSDAFEKQLLALIEKLPSAAKLKVLTHAGYDETAKRKFSKISSTEGYSSSYYLSSLRYKPETGRILIEDFLEGLKNLPLENEFYEIDHLDIVGKLFLYLWDNVFDRDKSPLYTLLGVPYQGLRTFGQFVDLANIFIERVCLITDTSAAKSASISAEKATEDAGA